jgi:DNA polymerase-3 subunit alpha
LSRDCRALLAMTNKMSNFVHLHGHTEYSLLDGLSKVKKLVARVKEMGMPAVAITDHGGMYGVIEFYKACVAANIKPIIGCELYVARRSHTDKEGRQDAEPYHLTVVAKDHEGYVNLMKLVSVGYLDGYYYRPRIDKELLRQHHQGLIALSGCAAGEFVRNLNDASYKESEEVAKTYASIFGEDNFFFEVQNHEYPKWLQNPEMDPRIKSDLERMGQLQDITWNAVKELSKKMGIPYVATSDFHYVTPDDAPAQDALVCVQTGKFIRDIDRLRMIDAPNLYIQSPDEMSQLFAGMPQALETSLQIADKVNVEITLGKASFPIFDIPQGLTPIEHLRKICEEQFAIKVPKDDPRFQERKERMDYELSVIDKKNYATYFLIVHDFIAWSHEHKIITNTRGSAAGSYVLYMLGVTNIDPIDFLLPFERFLNPFRPSLPDIDSDLADNRRDEVIRYMMDKYGHDKVAHIVTFGTMMGRAAIRDVGRVLGMPYAQVDSIAKLVPPPHQGFHKPLSDALKEVPELSQMYKADPEVRHLLDLAIRVEGTVRHASVHAAGIVIAPSELTNFTPLQRESNGDKIVTQYDMFAVGEDGVGLVKMDMLGIRNLSILGHATEIVKETQGIEVDLGKLPLDDKKSFELLGRGETMGLFQIESEGMTKNLVELKPTSFFDIMAMIALYRPGPIGIIPEYIDRKHHPEKIAYFDPTDESLYGTLSGTFGLSR